MSNIYAEVAQEMSNTNLFFMLKIRNFEKNIKFF